MKELFYGKDGAILISKIVWRSYFTGKGEAILISKIVWKSQEWIRAEKIEAERSTATKVGKGQQRSAKVKESGLFFSLLLEAEKSFETTSMPRLKFVLPFHPRTYNTIKGGSRRAEKSRKVLMMMKAAKLGCAGAGAGKKQGWTKSRARKGRSWAVQEQGRRRNLPGVG